MPQIFPKALNPIARVIVLSLPIVAASTGVGLAAFYRSSYATGVGETPPQPVAFSHAHHVGQLGIRLRATATRRSRLVTGSPTSRRPRPA